MAVEIDGSEFFLLVEVAELVGVSRQTLWRWRREGVIPVGRRYRGRHVLYTTAEIEAVREHANRIEPLYVGDAGQLALFGPRPRGASQ